MLSGSGAWHSEHTHFPGLRKLAEKAIQRRESFRPHSPPHVRQSAESTKSQSNHSRAQLSPICCKIVEKSPDLLGPQPFECQNEGLGPCRLHIGSPSRANSLPSLPVSSGATFLPQTGTGPHRDAWRPRHLGVVGAIRAHQFSDDEHQV